MKVRDTLSGPLMAVFLLLTVNTVAAASAVTAAHPLFAVEPTIAPNPNERVPLSAIVSFQSREPVSTRLTVSDGERTWSLNYAAKTDPAAGLAVVGMKYGRMHTITVQIENAAGEQQQSEPLRFRTPDRPTDPTMVPPVRVIKRVDDKMEPGLTIASLRRNLTRGGNRAGAAGASFGLLAAFDAAGEIVWSYYADARISDVEPTQRGTFLFVTTDNRVTEIDVLGNKLGEWYAGNRPQGPGAGIGIPTLTMHHEVDELSNGNILVMGTELREYDNWWTSEKDPEAPLNRERVMGDHIVEFTRDGKVVWEWKALDHLDPYRIGYETFTPYWIRRGFPGARDWSHGNGFFHDERDDSLLISFRMQDAVVKVDRKTGDIVWILGDHSGWPQRLQSRLLTPEGSMNWFYHQHMPQLTADGTLVVFDNRTWSARPFAPPLPPALTWTRAVEYRIDEERRTVRQVWESEGYSPQALMTFAMGEADVMPQTGNALVFYGSSGVVTDTDLQWNDVLGARGNRSPDRGTRIREFTRTRPSEVVWDVDLFDTTGKSGVRWAIYGGARISRLGAMP